MTDLRSSFSSSPAGSSVQSCPALADPLPPPPCNLLELHLIEASSDAQGKARMLVVRPSQPGGPTGNCLQVTATSAASATPNSLLEAPLSNAQRDQNAQRRRPRQVGVEIVTGPVCPTGEHPLLVAADTEGQKVLVAASETLTYQRPALPGDYVPSGLFAMIDSLFLVRGGRRYPIEARACGVGATEAEAAAGSLHAAVEVFPADEFSLELSIPALLKPDKLDYSRASAGWITEEQREKAALRDAQKKADAIYKAEREFMRDIGMSRKEFREFAEAQEKRRLGMEEEADALKGLKIALSRTDGERTIEANVDEIISLVRMIRNAEYRFKQFNDWIKTLQVGPGVMLEASCQFFVISLKARWGYREHSDERVFLWIQGSLHLDVITASLKASFGFRAAGLCDLILYLEGEGKLGLDLPQVERKTPDVVDVQPKVTGALTFRGGVEGTGAWVVKVGGKVEVTFKAETERLKVLSTQGILSGEVIVKRDAVEASLFLSCSAWGSRQRKVTLIEEDPSLAKFAFPPPATA